MLEFGRLVEINRKEAEEICKALEAGTGANPAQLAERLREIFKLKE